MGDRQSLHYACRRARHRLGLGFDPDQPVHRLVLYVNLPSGQVSFHAAERGPGPDYPASWDGVTGIGPQRILTWIGRLLDGAEAAP